MITLAYGQHGEGLHGAELEHWPSVAADISKCYSKGFWHCWRVHVCMVVQVGAEKELRTVIEGESLFNDGSAYVLFLLFRVSLHGCHRYASNCQNLALHGYHLYIYSCQHMGQQRWLSCVNI